MRRVKDRNLTKRDQATTGYARIQVDADKFNSSLNKPSDLIFLVKL